MGELRGYRDRSASLTQTYSFDVTQNDTNQAPATDTELNVSGANNIAISFDSTAAGSTSTGMDLNVITSPDDSTYDDGVTNIYTSKNFGDNQTGTLLVTPGVGFIKLRLDENNTGAAVVTATVVITW